MEEGNYKNILARFQKEKAKNDAEQNNELPMDSVPLENEEDKKNFEDELNRLRQGMQGRPKFIKKGEEECNPVDVPVSGFKVRRAFCPNCGTELVSPGPVMFDNWTNEMICPHKCAKCRTEFQLPHRYPRLVIIGEDGQEIKAFNTI